MDDERQTARRGTTRPPGPGQLAAAVHLLETFLDEDSDTLSPAEAKAIAEADEWSKHNDPIPHEQVLAEFGLTMADWERVRC